MQFARIAPTLTLIASIFGAGCSGKVHHGPVGPDDERAATRREGGVRLRLDGGRTGAPGEIVLEAPVAVAEPMVEATVGDRVQLDGTGSYDRSGDELSFAWTIRERPSSANAALVASTTATPWFVPDCAGVFDVVLTVSNQHGRSNSRSVTILVEEPERLLPSAYAGPSQTVEPGTTVRIDGRRSHSPSGRTLAFTWTMRSRPSGSKAALSHPDGANPSFRADERGVYVLDLFVSDDELRSPIDTVLITAQPAPAAPNVHAPAVLRVSNQVIQDAVEGIGMNLGRIAGGTNLATNNIIVEGNFEPLSYRRLIRVETSATDERGRWFGWQSDGGVGFWDTLGDGYANGAAVRVFRLVDAAGAPLPWRSMADADLADHVVRVGDAVVSEPSTQLPRGGYLPGAERVYLDQPLDIRRGDYVFLHSRRLEIPLHQIHPRIRPNVSPNKLGFRFGPSLKTGLHPHAWPVPTGFEMPGESCLEVVSSSAEPENMIGYYFHAYDRAEGQWYSQLHPGAIYKMSVWLRGDDLSSSARVRAVFVGGEPYDKLSDPRGSTVTNDWSEYTYVFEAPEYPTSGMHRGFGLEFVGPGRFFVDNLSLHRVDPAHGDTPNGAHVSSLGPWLASTPSLGFKPSVRFYPLTHSNSSIEALMGTNFGSATYHHDSGTLNGPDAFGLFALMGWALATGDSPGTRSPPFLTFNIKYTEEEWWAIVEYLGVPYDERQDTPESKPYAHLRYRQRGHGRPWTDEFREIILEYGNETWHNGAGGYGWDGFGPPGGVHAGGAEYGMFARHHFADHIMNHPLWRANGLSSKIKFALGGNYDASLRPNPGYGEAAMMRNSIASYLGHANYVGPKWETRDEGSSRFDAHGLQETLVGLPTGVEAMLREARESQRELSGTTGARYVLVAYEGGPSGYWTNKDEPELDERYGKSLAMGVAALDAWLASSLHGFRHQAFLGYGSGKWWTSHTMPEAGGFRPHPSWLALQMRNVYALGHEMLAVDALSEPAYMRSSRTGKTRIPLVSAYALRGPNATSVFLLSRKYPGVHDGLDFGEGYTPVTVQLPFSSVPRRVTRYALTRPDGSFADPADSNRFSENVVIDRFDVPPSTFQPDFAVDRSTGGGELGLPPGTVFLYVFEH